MKPIGDSMASVIKSSRKYLISPSYTVTFKYIGYKTFTLSFATHKEAVMWGIEHEPLFRMNPELFRSQYTYEYRLALRRQRAKKKRELYCS
jgi:hypothetical protein